jgi:hypothetical protein
MKKTIILLSLFVVLLIAGTYARRVGQSDVLKAECEKAGGTFENSSTTCTLPDLVIEDPAPAVATTTIDTMSDMIVVDDVSFATSTEDTEEMVLTVVGKARGMWYFEASFPVELIVGTTTVAKGIAEAQSDWMTEEFVPFEIEIEYATEYSGEDAVLILKKDNPSGLPENDAQIEQEVVLE